MVTLFQSTCFSNNLFYFLKAITYIQPMSFFPSFHFSSLFHVLISNHQAFASKIFHFQAHLDTQPCHTTTSKYQRETHSEHGSMLQQMLIAWL